MEGYEEMSSNSKLDIIEKIVTGLGKGHTDMNIGDLDDPVPENTFLSKPEVFSTDTLQDLFRTELEKVNGEIRIPEDRDDLEYKLIELIYGYKIEKCALADSDALNVLEVAEILKNRGVSIVEPGGNSIDISKADLGITGVDYAIADTGTLVVFSDDHTSRTFSLLPPVHIAFLKVGNILKDIHNLFYMLKETNRGITDQKSCLTFITGPSRTADIELNLTLGVHGPGKLIVFITR